MEQGGGARVYEALSLVIRGFYKEDVTKKPSGELTKEEKDLVSLHGLTVGQIAWRRTRLRLMKKQGGAGIAEDAVSCFLGIGGSVCSIWSRSKRRRRRQGRRRSPR